MSMTDIAFWGVSWRSGGVEAIEYERLAAYENWYWWYRAERELLVDTVRRLNLKPGSRVLDAGCGSGRNLVELAGALEINGYGLDNSVHAAALWNGRGRVGRCMGSVNAIPYAEASFEAVVCVDVMQSREVEPRTTMKELARVVRPGGRVVVLAPAFQWLLSRHDAAVHSVRRFDRAGLRSMACEAGLTVTRLTHAFPVFFPVIAAVRLLRKVEAANGAGPLQSDLSTLPRWLNRVLLTIARLEQRAIRHADAPFGSTILLVARKREA